MTVLFVSATVSLVVTGAVIGVTGVVCLGIRREERDHSVTGDAVISTIRGVRRLTGLGVRGYSYAGEPVHSDQQSRPLRAEHMDRRLCGEPAPPGRAALVSVLWRHRTRGRHPRANQRVEHLPEAVRVATTADGIPGALAA